MRFCGQLVVTFFGLAEAVIHWYTFNQVNYFACCDCCIAGCLHDAIRHFVRSDTGQRQCVLENLFLQGALLLHDILDIIELAVS